MVDDPDRRVGLVLNVIEYLLVVETLGRGNVVFAQSPQNFVCFKFEKFFSEYLFEFFVVGDQLFLAVESFICQQMQLKILLWVVETQKAQLDITLVETQ